MVSARALALRALVSLARGRSERLRSELEGQSVEGRELAFAFELSHGVIRRERLLDHVVAGFADRGLPKDPLQLVVMRLGAYQLLFVPGMKPHAAVHETVGLLRNNKGFANAVLRRVAKSVVSRLPVLGRDLTEVSLPADRTVELACPLPEDEVERLAVQHSLPSWLAARFADQHGLDGLKAIGIAASSTPDIFLRTLRAEERSALQEELIALGVEVDEAEHPHLLRWKGGASPFGTAPFDQGRFVVQDPTAMCASQAVPCKPGDTVVDLCAAPGTKTSWLASRVQPDGRVYAYDIDERRLVRIRENAERLRLADTIRVVHQDADLPVSDCVLADVPCSNSGVLGRRVEARLRLQQHTFEELSEIQKPLLAKAIDLTKPGGHTIYSTCSIDQEENEGVVAAVLRSHPGVKLVHQKLTLPEVGQHDGGYFAVLRRGDVPEIDSAG